MLGKMLHLKSDASESQTRIIQVAGLFESRFRLVNQELSVLRPSIIKSPRIRTTNRQHLDYLLTGGVIG